MKDNVLRTTFNNVKFGLKKNSPIICIVGGIGLGIGATIVACKATTKIDKIKEDKKNKLDKIHEAVENGEIETDEGTLEYTEEDAKKDTTIIYGQTYLKYAKLYAPAVGLGVSSIALILTGYNVLNKRMLGFAAAYTTTSTSFRNYRNRVIDKFGEEIDKELKYNIKEVEVEEKVVDEKTGKEKTVKTKKKVADPNAIYDAYSRIWGPGNLGWCPDPHYRKKFLITQQAYANEKLKKEGYLCINDVYKMLGYRDIGPEGNVIGWIYDKKTPVGDNYVDFGIFDIDIEKVADFEAGIEEAIVLNFNHDGNMLKYGKGLDNETGYNDTMDYYVNSIKGGYDPVC